MRRRRTAHRFGDRRRTTDVLTEETLDFSGLMLSSAVLEGLRSAGFERPSPIQLKAIPLGRCGLDLIAQAKSGTGKTCVFSVIALENINIAVASIQVLVLAPTREIAVQIKDVMSSIGRHIEGLRVHVFIGGMPVEEDKQRLKQCHVAVGTPGRVKSLIENKFLKTDSIRLFILDEADKLLDDSFQSQTNWIFSTLPVSKQMLALSATYTDHLAQHLKNYMKDPTFVRLNASDPALEGIRHYRLVVPCHSLPHQVFQEKVKTLLTLLSRLPFHQCLIFSNYQIRARNLSETLSKNGWPSTYISGSQGQNERLKAMEKLKEFKCRILISTDLTSRGIDAERVNLVINMDIPRDSQTYLHRVGRAGRFGSYGAAVNFVAEGKEVASLDEIEAGCGVVIDTLPEDISQLLSAPVTCNGKQPMSSVTTTVVGLEPKISLAEGKCAGKEEVAGHVDVGTAERRADCNGIDGDNIEAEGSAGGEVRDKKEDVEMNALKQSSYVVPETKEEEFENKTSVEQQVEHVIKSIDRTGECESKLDTKLRYTQPGDIDENGICYSDVLAGKHDKKEAAKESSCSAVAEEKPGNKESQENLVDYLENFEDIAGQRECFMDKIGNDESAEDRRRQSECLLRESRDGEEKPENKESQENLDGYLGNFEDRAGERECCMDKSGNGEFAEDKGGQSECLLRERRNGELSRDKGDQSECLLKESCDSEFSEKCFSNTDVTETLHKDENLREHREDNGHLRNHRGIDVDLQECGDTKELLVECRETKEQWGINEDHGELHYTNERHEGQLDKMKHLGEHCGTGEHFRDNRDDKERLDRSCNNKKNLKVDCASEFSEDINGSEDVLDDIGDVDELHGRDFIMPLKKLNKVEVSSAQNGTERFSEVESSYARHFKNQSCNESSIEGRFDARKNEGDYSKEAFLDCGVRNEGPNDTELENGLEFSSECFDGRNMNKSPIIFRRSQTGGSVFAIETTWVPGGSQESESPFSEETGNKNPCFVGPRSSSIETGSERACSVETGFEDSCSRDTGSERSCSKEAGSDRSFSEETASERSCSEETGSESSDIESPTVKIVAMSGEDFDNVLESYLQTNVSGNPSTVRTEAEEASTSDVATESRALIGVFSPSKVTGKPDGRPEAISPIDKPPTQQVVQACTETDEDDVIETRHHVSHDSQSAACGSGCDVGGSQAIGHNSEDAMFYGASAEDVSGYLSTLPGEWKRVWSRAYERQTGLISTYTKVYRDAFY